MQAANSDYIQCSIPKVRQNHCLPPTLAGNGLLRIWTIIPFFTQSSEVMSYESNAFPCLYPLNHLGLVPCEYGQCKDARAQQEQASQQKFG